MKLIKILNLILCLFLLGGCNFVKSMKEYKQKQQDSCVAMEAYIENKYQEKFELHSSEFVPTAEGGYNAHGNFIPEKYPQTYVRVSRKEDVNGNIKIKDNYQSYVFGNEFFEYVNDDIRKTHTDTFAYTDINIVDNHSTNLSFQECKNTSYMDIFIAWYVDEDKYTEENIKQAAQEYARKYHKEFNNAFLMFTVFLTDSDGVKHLKQIAQQYQDSEYYVLQKEINDNRSSREIKIKNNVSKLDISITSKGVLEYKVKSIKQDDRTKSHDY